MESFDDLNRAEYIEYLRRAQYLIDRGYVLDKPLFELAELIHKRDNEQKKNADSNNS